MSTRQGFHINRSHIIVLASRVASHQRSSGSLPRLTLRASMCVRSQSYSWSSEWRLIDEGAFLNRMSAYTIVSISDVRLNFSSFTIELRHRNVDVWAAADIVTLKFGRIRLRRVTRKSHPKRQITNFEGGRRRDSRPGPSRRDFFQDGRTTGPFGRS